MSGSKKPLDVSKITKESTRNYIRYVVHSRKCSNSDCTRACQKMKKRIMHVRSCTIQLRGGCDICTYTYLMLYYHAKQCQRDVCEVPNCASLKELIQDTLLRIQLRSLKV